MDDRSLRTRLMDRDATALREIVEAHGPTVNGVARRVLAAKDLAEDVTQEVFLYLWSHAEAFDPARSSLRGWLCIVARNRAIDRVRSEERHRRPLPTEPAISPDPSSATISRRAVMEALSSLTELQREALFLAYFEGLTYREVAEALDTPLGTIKTRIRDGLTRLRTNLDRLALAS